jgi:hypothetical protein
VSAQADEQRLIQRWNALNGCSDDSRSVKRVEKFVKLLGIGNDTPSGVNSDPPTPIALHDQLFHCPYRSQGVRQEPLTRREPSSAGLATSSAYSRRAVQGFGQRGGDAGIGAVDGVGVGAQRHRWVGVPQPAGNGTDVVTSTDRLGGRPVAQVV